MTAMAKDVKTNVMRILEKEKISYKHYDYSKTGCTNGNDIAKILGENLTECLKPLLHRAVKQKTIMFLWCR